MNHQIFASEADLAREQKLFTRVVRQYAPRRKASALSIAFRLSVVTLAVVVGLKLLGMAG